MTLTSISSLEQAKAHFSAGRQQRQQGDLIAAVASFQEALRCQKDYLPAYNNLANLYQAQGKLDEALALYKQALVLAPDKAVLHCNQASLWQLKGDTEQALAGFKQTLTLDPVFAPAYHNLGKLFTEQGSLKKAVVAYQATLRIQPANAEAYLELGHLYRQQGLLHPALEHYRAAVRCQPPSATAYNALGATLKLFGDIKLAALCYRRALILQPTYEAAHFNLGLLLEDVNQLADAQRHYEKALALNPDATVALYHLTYVRLKLADWQAYGAGVKTLIAQTQARLADPKAEPLPVMILNALPVPAALQQAVAKHVADSHSQTVAPLLSSLPAVRFEDKPARLRIGYVSPDFRNHAVGTLIQSLFQYHQRPDFEIFAYSLVPVDDDITQVIREGCDHFINVAAFALLAIAKRIRADGIHILIDLAGYTTHSLTPVFALKPAPLQIQYLGYPGSMQADFMPYILADNTLIPEDLAAQYSEQVLRLPHAWATAPMTIADSTLTRADVGLPEKDMVYCCFNGTYKINPAVFTVWMRILQAVPNSVLWLSTGRQAIVKQRLQQQAEALGVAPERLIFADNVPHAEYLARYRLADVFLDTFPYNAGATAVGALAAGLPILTLSGERYVSRMGACVCNAVGVPELLCRSIEDYEQQAIELGKDPKKRAVLTAKLAKALPNAPLFKPQAFIKHLEQTLTQLWQNHTKHTNH
jgi:predicted O-linked N-acetylglucosamine transferase (SPINDLY family)